MNSRLIFFDVDGTIITGDGFIPPSAAAAIRAARQAGNLCIVNTGRPYSHIVPAVKDMGFSGFVCSCGQHIIFSDSVVYHDGFDAETSADIIALIRACRLEAAFEAEAGVWFLPGDPPYDRLEANMSHFIRLGFDVSGSIDSQGFRFDKFCVWPTFESDISAFIDHIAPLCEIIFREDNMLELVKKGNSKQTGIQRMIALTGAALDDCYAIGDSTNDLPMFSCITHSIAMGGAPHEVKCQVEYVTADILEDGLAKALDRFGLTR